MAEQGHLLVEGEGEAVDQSQIPAEVVVEVGEEGRACSKDEALQGCQQMSIVYGNQVLFQAFLACA